MALISAITALQAYFISSQNHILPSLILENYKSFSVYNSKQKYMLEVTEILIYFVFVNGNFSF